MKSKIDKLKEKLAKDLKEHNGEIVGYSIKVENKKEVLIGLSIKYPMIEQQNQSLFEGDGYRIIMQNFNFNTCIVGYLFQEVENKPKKSKEEKED